MSKSSAPEVTDDAVLGVLSQLAAGSNDTKLKDDIARLSRLLKDPLYRQLSKKKLQFVEVRAGDPLPTFVETPDRELIVTGPADVKSRSSGRVRIGDRIVAFAPPLLPHEQQHTLQCCSPLERLSWREPSPLDWQPGTTAAVVREPTPMVLSGDWVQIERVRLSTQQGGLGFGIVGGASTGVVVKTVLPGSPADKDKRLRPGDHILQIGNVNTHGMSSQQVATILRQQDPHVNMVVGRPIAGSDRPEDTRDCFTMATRQALCPASLDERLAAASAPDSALSDHAPSDSAHSLATTEEERRAGKSTDGSLASVSRVNSAATTEPKSPTESQRSKLSRASVRSVKREEPVEEKVEEEKARKESVAPLENGHHSPLEQQPSTSGLNESHPSTPVSPPLPVTEERRISLKSLQELALTVFCRENWEKTEHDEITVTLRRDPALGLGITVAGYVHRKEEIGGVFVKSLVPKSAAAYCGKIKVHDLILKVNGVSLEHLSHADSVRALVRSGNSVRLSLIRFRERSPQALCLRMLHQQETDTQVIDVQSSNPDLINEWRRRLDADVDIVTAVIRPADAAGDGRLGISLEGTVDVVSGAQLCPHHYIESIRRDGPAAKGGQLQAGDEILQVNHSPLYGESHVTVRQALSRAASAGAPVTLVVARKRQRVGVFAPCVQGRSLPASYPLLAGNDVLVKAKSEQCLAVASEPEEGMSLRLRSRSLEPFAGLAIWNCVPLIVYLEKDARGLGFSVVDYKDPLHPTETVIVVQSLVPGGAAQADGRIVPGDRLLHVNEHDLSSCSLERAVSVLKSAPLGRVRLGIAKPVPIDQGRNSPLISRSERLLAKGSSPRGRRRQPPTVSTETVWIGADEYRRLHPQGYFSSRASSRSERSLAGSDISMSSWSPCSSRSPSPCMSPWASDVVYLPTHLERTISVTKGPLAMGVVLDAERDKGVNGCVVKSICGKKAVGLDGRIQVGDYLVQVNSECLRNVTSARARAILKRANLIGTMCNVTYITAADARTWRDRFRREEDTRGGVNHLSPKVFPKFYHSPYYSGCHDLPPPPAELLAQEEECVSVSLAQSTALPEMHDDSSMIVDSPCATLPRQANRHAAATVDGRLIDELAHEMVQSALRDAVLDYHLSTRLPEWRSKTPPIHATPPSTPHDTPKATPPPPPPRSSPPVYDSLIRRDSAPSALSSPERRRFEERDVRLRREEKEEKVEKEEKEEEKQSSPATIDRSSVTTEEPRASSSERERTPQPSVLSERLRDIEMEGETSREQRKYPTRSIRERSADSIAEQMAADVLASVEREMREREREIELRRKPVVDSPTLSVSSATSHKLPQHRQVTDRAETQSTGARSVASEGRPESQAKKSSKFWGEARTVTLHREPNKSFGISIVGGRVEVSQRGGLPGTGNTVSGIFIKSVMSSSPAGLSGGMNMGDRVISVNGVDLREATHEQAVKAIRNAENPVRFVLQSLHSFSPAQQMISSSGSTSTVGSIRIESKQEKEKEQEKSSVGQDSQPSTPKSTDIRKKSAASVKSQKMEEPVKKRSIDAASVPYSKRTSVGSNSIKDDRPLIVSDVSSSEAKEDDDEGEEEEKEEGEQFVKELAPTASTPQPMDDDETLRRKYSESGDVFIMRLHERPENGLGVSLAGNKDRSTLSVFVASLAAHCPLPLKIGDQLMQVNDRVLKGGSHVAASAAIREELQGGPIRLVILRRKDAAAEIAFRPGESREEEKEQEEEQGEKEQKEEEQEKEEEEQCTPTTSTGSPGQQENKPLDTQMPESQAQPSGDTALHSVENIRKKSWTGVERSAPIDVGKESHIEIDKDGKGLGLSIVGGADTVLGTVVIHEVYPDGAAAVDGRLKPGDQVLEVNSVSLRGVNHDQAISLLRRTPPKVRLLIYRDANLQLSLLDPAQIYNIFEVELTKRPGRGLGLSIVGRKNEPGVYVSEVVKGGAAEADNRLMTGDQILAVNDQDVANSMQEHVAALLKTCTGRVKLKIGRWKITETAHRVHAAAEAAFARAPPGASGTAPVAAAKPLTMTDARPSTSSGSGGERDPPPPAPPMRPLITHTPPEDEGEPQPTGSGLSPVTEEPSSGGDQRSAAMELAEACTSREPPASPASKEPVQLLRELNEDGSDTLLIELKKQASDQQLGMGIGKRARGILVTSLQPGSTAAERLRVGDRLLAVNGLPVTDQLSAVTFVKASDHRLFLQIARPRTTPSS